MYYLEQLDGSPFHFHPLAVWTPIVLALHKDSILKESNVYNRKTGA